MGKNRKRNKLRIENSKLSLFIFFNFYIFLFWRSKSSKFPTCHTNSLTSPHFFFFFFFFLKGGLARLLYSPNIKKIKTKRLHHKGGNSAVPVFTVFVNTARETCFPVRNLKQNKKNCEARGQFFLTVMIEEKKKKKKKKKKFPSPSPFSIPFYFLVFYYFLFFYSFFLS